MAHQLLLDFAQEDPGVLVVLFSLSNPEVSRKLAKMIEDGSANLFVSGASRPEVRGYSASNADHAPEGGRTKFFIFCHQKARPAPEVLKKPVEFPVNLMGIGNFSVSLLDVLHDVDDLTQDSVESVDRIIRWHVGGRKASFAEDPKGGGIGSMGRLSLVCPGRYQVLWKPSKSGRVSIASQWLGRSQLRLKIRAAIRRKAPRGAPFVSEIGPSLR
jgi:hypothetical protein